MTPPTYRSALEDAEAALAKLDRGCCDPGRSPQMAALADTLRTIGTHARAVIHGSDEGAAGSALEAIEQAGAQLGRLQVTCCAPARMPLYARMLEDLTTVQIEIARALGTAH